MRRLVGMTDMPATGVDFFLIDRVVIDAFLAAADRHVSVFALLMWLGFRREFIEYDKQRCIDLLMREIGYRPYPYKHYESVFTRFYQGYLLPMKFGVDKRRLHLSSLICSGQMTRERAVELLSQSPYPDPDDLRADIDYFLKKMGWSQQDLDAYLARPERPHTDFRSEAGLYDALLRLQKRWLPGR